MVLMKLGSRGLKESLGRVEIIEGIQCLLCGLFPLALWSKCNCRDVQIAKVLLCSSFHLVKHSLP